MKESTHFLNGKFVKESELVVSIRDLGFSRGYAVFDFLITYPPHGPFLLDRHIDRLFNSAEKIELPIPWSKVEVTQWVLDTLLKNDSTEQKAIKIAISGGISDSLAVTNTPTIAIIVDPRHAWPESWYENGISMMTAHHERYAPEAKTNNYIQAIREVQRAKALGAIEPIYYNDSHVFEAATANVFAIINGKLLTPKSHILPGITRAVLLEILKLDIPVEEKDFSLSELFSAAEVFLTASNKEVIGVVKIDGKEIANGKVGHYTKEAARQFREFTASGAW